MAGTAPRPIPMMASMRLGIRGRAQRPTAANGYQPALDGVRAVSVVAVLLFHAGVSWMTGGYLGVSVFFTLSGFLITRLLLGEHERTGRIDPRAFYARRARRLLPASVVCLVGVCLFAAGGAFDGVADLRRDVVGAALQVANWTSLAGDGGYAEQLAAEAGRRSPLTHYWSLAIEEQFYWLWPLGAGLLLRWAGRGADVHRRAFWAVGTATLLFAGAAPLIATVWGEQAAYWATPARTSEILVGGLLAVALRAFPRLTQPRWPLGALGRAALGVLGAVCLAAIGAACVLAPSGSGFAYDGGLPLFAVLSSGLLWSLQVQHPLTTALGAAPLAWLGRLSYGVYLYHWPVYVLLDERRTGIDDTTALLALRVVVTMAVAVASYYVIEQPIRHGSMRPLLVAQSAVAATAVVVVAAIVLVPTTDANYFAAAAPATDTLAPGATLAPLIPVTEPAPSRSPSTTGPAVVPASAVPATGPTTTMRIETTTAQPPSTAPPASLVPARPVRILVVGDSTAEATARGLIAWAESHPDLATVSLSVERGCGFLPGGDMWVDDRWQRVPDRCEDWLRDGLPETVDAVQPDVAMLMTTSWDVLDRRWPDSDARTPADQGYRDRLQFAMQGVTDGLLAHGVADVVWVEHPIAYPLWLTDTTQSEPDRHVPLYDGMRRLADASPAVSVLDLAGWVDERGWSGDRDARPDGIHWSPAASTTVATEFLGPALVDVALQP
jgi:peptidoglycan/LPS O-acetylase OafA/YrhL